MSSRKSAYSQEAWERHKARERERYAAKCADPAWRKGHTARVYRYVTRNREILTAIRLERGCVDCGTRDGRLDFDHRLGETKMFNLAHPRCSVERLMVEVAKCDVRCAACHTRRHNLAPKST